MADIDKLRAELRAGLEGTTPGEWKTRVHAESTKPDAVVADGKFVARCRPLFGRPHHHDEACENARHIALASPQNVAALLGHIDRLEARAKAAEAELARLRRGEAVADWSDAPRDLYVTELRKVDQIVWEGSVCNVPMAVAPEVRYVRADAAEAELARLRERLGPRGLEVVMIDGVGHYVSEAVAKEFANLRKPAGNVGEVVKRLLKGQCDVDFTCAPQCGCVTAREAADLLTRLAAENAHLKAPPTDGEVGGMVKRLLMVAVIIKGEKAQVATDAADLITRLAARVAEGERLIGWLLNHPSNVEAKERARNYLQKDKTNADQQ